MTRAQIITGDVREVLPTLPSESVQCVVTSPPYWGLRDYGVDGQMGLEQTPAEYVAGMVAVFREVWRVLRDDGVVFLNLGDSYYGSGKGRNADGSFHEGSLNGKQGTNRGSVEGRLFKTGARAADVREYGTSDTTGSGCPDRDSSSRSHGDGRTDALSNRTTDSGCHPALAPVAELCSRTQACMATLLDHLPIGGCSAQQPSTRSLVAIRDLARTASHEVALALASLDSMPLESWQQLQGDSRLSGSLSAYQSALRSFVAGAQAFDRMLGAASDSPDGMVGIASLCEALGHHIRCTVECCSILSAWLNPPKIQPYCTTLKPKDLVGIPWRVAFALQDDGWYLRSDIIWSKPNPMPESVRDRPTRAHEYIFLLAKQSRYFYDADAIAEKSLNAGRVLDYTGDQKNNDADPVLMATRPNGRVITVTATRNKRTVWTIATQPFSQAHFAVFPEALVEPCILAGSSERGCCPECGAPWRRVVERESLNRTELPNDHPHYRPGYYTRKAGGDDQYANGGGQRISTSTTTGWEPTCTHDVAPVPCTVLDPFSGAGTVGVVALRQGRNYIGVELNSEYVEMSRRRIAGDAPLLNVVEATG